MGKKGSSWFRAVKRAFGSPSKDCDSKRCRRYHSSSIAEAEQVSVAKKEKIKEKRKWVFGKSAYFEDHQEKSSSDNKEEKEKEKHGITVVSSSCEADIGVARPSTSWAAIRIQTAFRAYLARRALRALRGLVRLQALVRGYNVRKQTNATLRCMEALVRVQLRVRDGRLLQVQAQAHQQEAMDRKSLSHSRDSQQHWDDRTHIHTAEKQSKEAAAAKRERALAYAFSHQLRKSGGKEGASSFLDKGQGQGQGHWGWSWLDRWMAARPWETTSVEKDCKSANDIAIKTVQVDRGRGRGRGRGSSYSQPHEYASSPAHHSPASANTAPAPRRSSSPSHSPRSCGRHSIYNQEIFFPRLGSRRTSNINDDFNSIANSAAVPNYMAATESARAKARSQSAPRQRAGTPEKERWPTCVKKRLSFPALDANNTSTSTMHQKSPSLKGIPGPIKIERSNLSFTQSSNGGETTPSSIGNLRKWLG